MAILDDKLPQIKDDLNKIVSESLRNLSYIVSTRDYFFHKEDLITNSFYLAFYEFCKVEEGADVPMEATIKNINEQINNASSESFETAGLYGNQLKTKIELVIFNWKSFEKKIISPKRWLECLKSLMISIFSIYGGDEAHKELLDMGINIITDQLPAKTHKS